MPEEITDRVLLTIAIVSLAVVFGSMAAGINNVCYRVGSNQVVCNDTNKVYKLKEVQ